MKPSGFLILLTAALLSSNVAVAADDPVPARGRVIDVASAEEWMRDVRPHVIAFFDENVYGQYPPKPMQLSFDLVECGPAFSGAAERRQYVVRSADVCGEHAFDVLVYLPAGQEAVPAFIYPNFSGNHSLVDDPAAPDPVFRLFGKSIGWHLKTGPHSITHEDWRWFMDYARTELAW